MRKKTGFHKKQQNQSSWILDVFMQTNNIKSGQEYDKVTWRPEKWQAEKCATVLYWISYIFVSCKMRINIGNMLTWQKETVCGNFQAIDTLFPIWHFKPKSTLNGSLVYKGNFNK